MLPYREIIELRSMGLSLEKVAYLTGCSIAKAKKIIECASSLGLGWPVPMELTEEELQQLVDKHPDPRNHPIDYTTIYEKVRSRKIPDKPSGRHMDAAWEAYLELSENAELPAFSQKSFFRQYKAWLVNHTRKITMPVNWTPAEEVEVDWAGKTIPIYGKDGHITPAYLFVATLPYSNYTFVRASLDMSMQSWLEHHCALFEFLGGAPIFLVPDNVATAVTFKRGFKGNIPMTDRRTVNQNYRDMADHYGVIIEPTRVYSPNDKIAVEISVRYAANRFISLLEQMRFTSIDQLNLSLTKLIEAYNERDLNDYWRGVTRKEMFEQEEAPFLAPLPSTPFVPVTWDKAKVSKDAVITVRGVYYGIPLDFAEKEVCVRISDTFVDVYTADRKQKILRHARGEDGSHTFEGFAGRRPDRFKPLSEWAEQNGRHALLEQWNPAKNEGLTPGDVVCFSEKKVWWRCGECGYEWQETPRARVGRAWDDCLACANVDLVPGRNDLATLYPEIAAEWHPTKNGCEPSEVFPDHTLSVWWKGSECGHEWFCGIKTRTKSATGRLCPYCSGRKALPGFNDVKTLCPELAALWHPSKNRKNKSETTSVLAKYRAFLQEGMFGEMWIESPRSWMLRNGYADALEPFLARIAEAKEEDAACQETGVESDDPNAASKMQVRRYRHKALWSEGMSLKEWCESFGREQLLEEWHPSKNGMRTPDNTAHGSSLKAWWLCPKCGLEWEDYICRRKAEDKRCPACVPKRRIVRGLSDLAGLSTSFLKYYSAANELPPEQISDHHSGPLWWECPDCGKKWKASLDRFPGQRGSCPFCDKWVDRLRYAELEKWDLASRFPQIAAFWHPTRNEGLEPFDVKPYTTQEVWWSCPRCGHEWQEIVKNRVISAKNHCSFCYYRADESVSSNSNGTKSGHKRRGYVPIPGFNDLATVNPALAAEWHPTKNGRLKPSDVMPASRTKVWWLCAQGHEWAVSVGRRSGTGSGCPTCANLKRGIHPDSLIVKGKTLAAARPEIVDEWHPTKNGVVTPKDVKAGSNKKFWWICGKGHEWEASATARSRGENCPYCSSNRLLAGYNDLATLYPHIAEQWHPARNGELKPSDVLGKSRKKAWWLCPHCGESWLAKIANRTATKGYGCPECTTKLRRKKKPTSD